jgi:hypothetical protein
VADSPYWKRVNDTQLKPLPPADSEMRAAGLEGRWFMSPGDHEEWGDPKMEGILNAVPYLKRFGVTPDNPIYKFDFKGARFIYLWSGKYDAQSPSRWTSDRPKYAEQMKQLQKWLDEAKAKGIKKAFITFHYPTFARSGFGGIPAPDHPHKVIAAYAKDMEVVVFNGHIGQGRLQMDAEHRRLEETRSKAAPWRKWGAVPLGASVGDGARGLQRLGQRVGLLHPRLGPLAGHRWGEDGLGGFTTQVKDWLATARHPRFKRPYTELVYQPMLEVMALFRASGYKTYLVTGGGQDFVREYSEQVYGVPPEQVVGTAGGTKFGYDKADRPMLTKEPKLLLNDDKAGKPEGIHLIIGGVPWPRSGIRSGTSRCWSTPRRGTALG